MNKIILFFLTLLFFKPFGLDQVDKFGLTSLPMFAATKVFRILWIMLIIVFLLYLVYKLYIYTKRNLIKIEIPIFTFLFIILYMYILIASFVLSDYSGMLGFYRLFELSVIMLSLLILLSISPYQDFNLQDLVQKAILINFYFIVIILLFWLVKDSSMIYQLETQGRTRLGGAVYSPNELGIICSVTIWSVYYLFFKQILNKKVFIITIAIALAIIILTNSRTSIVIAFGSILYMLYKQNIMNKIIIIFMGTFGLFFILMTFSINDLGYGNDPLEELKTLNNRTYIYQVAFDGIRQNPWFGTGYVEGTKEFLKENFTQDFWLPPHTHNGYIEIALSLGLPFFIIFFLISIRMLFISIKNIIFSTNKMKLATSMQIIIIMLTSITTVVIGNTINPLFTLFLFFLFSSLILQKSYSEINNKKKTNAI